MQKSRVSIVDIAKKVGCTAASVSLVLNDSPLPSAKMRQKVKRAASQLGYVPNRMAQSLKRGRTFMLGVVMPYCGEGYVPGFLDSLSVEAAECGYQLEIHFHRWSTSEEDRILRLLSESRAEGIILCGARLDYSDVPSISALAAQKIPVILIGSRSGLGSQCSIVIDRESGAGDLGRYLGQLGHSQVDYLEPILNRDAIEKPDPVTTGIISGLLQGLRQFQAAAQVRLWRTPVEHLQERRDIEHHGFSAKSAEDILSFVVSNYLSSNSQATAVVTYNLTTAWKLLAEMHRQGLRCPDDLSVACFAVEETGALGAIPLTSLEFSVEMMARKAVSAMVAAIAGRDPAKTINVPTRLEVRSSCRVPDGTTNHASLVQG